MNQNSEMLTKRIEENLGTLGDLKGEERAQAVKELDTLYRLHLDEIKIEKDARFKTTEHQDQVFKEQAELHDQKVDRRAKMVLDALGTIAQIGMYGILIVGGLKFEQTGTIGSPFVKDVIRSAEKFLKK